MPAFMYRDPSEAAERLEESNCRGCKQLVQVLDRELCGVGRRELKRCKRYELKKQ